MKFKWLIIIFALAFQAGCATDGDTRGLGQRTKDMTITSDVNVKFMADSNINASSIDVDTYDGVVTLTGTVNREVDIERSTEIAKSIRNVKQVINNLTLEQ